MRYLKSTKVKFCVYSVVNIKIYLICVSSLKISFYFKRQHELCKSVLKVKVDLNLRNDCNPGLRNRTIHRQTHRTTPKYLAIDDIFVAIYTRR